MRVICDNCGAVYRIPDKKLTKPVNKATCRKCGYKMLIPRAVPESEPDSEEQTLISPASAATGASEIKKAVTDPHEEKTVPEIPTPTPNGQATPPKDMVTPKQGDQPGKTASELDPSADMLWALLGICSALVGALILATRASDLTNSVGLFMTLGGGFAALFVIVTTGRGRHAGKPMLSISIGVGLSFFISTLFIFIPQIPSVTAQQSAIVSTSEEVTSEDEASLSEDAEEENTESAEEVDEDQAENTEEEADTGLEAEAQTEDTGSKPEAVSQKKETKTKVVPEKSSTPKQTEKPARETNKVSSSTSSKSAPTPTPTPAPKPAPAPKPTTDSAAMATIPHNITHTILTNNNDIKMCFGAHYKQTKSLPKEVGLKFKVMSNGRVSSTRVTTAALSSTPLAACLSSRINKLQFPPISSPSQDIVYNFVLN